MGRNFDHSAELNSSPGLMRRGFAAKATPDGHTLLIASATILAVNSVLGKVTYDPAKDFSPITLLGSQPHLMVVHPTVPANSVQEFVALAKSKPSQLNLASGGTGAGQRQWVSRHTREMNEQALK